MVMYSKKKEYSGRRATFIVLNEVLMFHIYIDLGLIVYPPCFFGRRCRCRCRAVTLYSTRRRFLLVRLVTWISFLALLLLLHHHHHLVTTVTYYTGKSAANNIG